MSDTPPPRRRDRRTPFQSPLATPPPEIPSDASPTVAIAPAPKLSRLTLATFAYALWLLGLSTLNAVGVDRWWWSSLNLYAPQWVWAIPALVLLLVALKKRRKPWATLLMLLWIFVAQMDFRWHSAQAAPAKESGTRLRVLTYNVKNGNYGLMDMLHAIQKENADLVLIQQAHGTYKDSVAAYFQNWNVQGYDQYLVASRYPISEINARSIRVRNRDFILLRGKIQLPNRTFTFYNVHLVSPRGGLNALRSPGRTALRILAENTQQRQIQGTLLAQYLRQEWGPVILAGDLNATVHSVICEDIVEANLSNAFDEAGRGYGYTYGHTLPLRGSFLRLDHIFASKEWRILNCYTGSPRGSDHRPLIADLFLPNG